MIKTKETKLTKTYIKPFEHGVMVKNLVQKLVA